MISHSSKKVTLNFERVDSPILAEEVPMNSAESILVPVPRRLSSTEIEELIKSEIEPAIVNLASDTMTFDQELVLANNFFRAIELVSEKSASENWRFDIDFAKKIFDELLGESKKHVSAFAFHRAAKTFCDGKSATNIDRADLIKPFTDSKIYQKSDSEESDLSNLINQYFKTFLHATEKTAEDDKDDWLNPYAAERKLIRSLKALKEP